ncbi:MAG: sigma-70 family RNA polymerase sigma factor [Bacilli bacterium]|nr:sigma-70 family RNA polymerase sigma factor [Bacilli bacterium]
MEYSNLFVETDLPHPLNEEELNKYFEKMYYGDLNARNEIIEHNIRFVIKQVKREFSNTQYEINELVSVGMIGLIKSVDTFDINKKIKFITYSQTCIRNEILMYIRRNKRHNYASLDEPIMSDEDGNDINLMNILFDEKTDIILDYEKKELYEKLRNIIYNLPEKYFDILNMQYGFDGNNPMTQKQIGEIYGVCPSYISRTQKKTLELIKKELQNQKLIEVNKVFIKK